ncbi:hypothetical protein AB0M22_19775 [Nocardia sp. NPDC051756]|uniref:hypothetical protein n=1 Tax=Nocardia sp. NPDC051756 TaxID=3154751 RepID=UPI00341AEDC6
MNPAEGARRLLAQLRLQSQAFDGMAVIDESLARKGVEWYLKQAIAPTELNEERLRSLTDQMTRPGRFTVDELWDAHFMPIVEQIEKAVEYLPSSGRDGEQHIVIGHLATGQLNAMTMAVPGHPGSYLITLEDGIISFCSFICHIISCAVPHVVEESGETTFNLSDREAEEWVGKSPKLVDQFTELVARYAVIGNIHGVQIPATSAGCLRLSEMLTYAADYFVVGHEYAHVLVGHFDNADVRREILPIIDAESFAYSWQQELDADIVGAILAMLAIEQFDYATGFAGIEIFFGMFDVIDRAVSLLQTGDEDARQLGTHPPASLRRRSLRAALPRLAGGDPRVAEQLEMAVEVADGLAKIIDILWIRTKPFLIDLRARGIPAAQKWRTISKNLA